MNLADRATSGHHRLDYRQVFFILCTASLGFVFGVWALFFLYRLGMGIGLLVNLSLFLLAVFVFILALLGRTMTSPVFFFARRIASPAQIGIGGGSDFVSGAVLALLLTASALQQISLVLALMLALLWQACLFSSAMQRSGVSTLAGFFAWRTSSQRSGVLALGLITAMILLLMSAELDIAIGLLSQITPWSYEHIRWLLIILAALPALFGGWMSLLLVNGALMLALLVCMLVPPVAVSMIPSLIEKAMILQEAQKFLPLLNLPVGGVFNGNSGFVLLLMVLVFSAGFAVLPHSLSRMTLARRSVGAIEAMGWTALCCWLLLGSFSFSLGFLLVTGAENEAMSLLQNQPVLYLLLYLGVLFAAFNALCVMLFVLASSIVRAARRQRQLNPDEQSIFKIRLLVVVFVLLVGFMPREFVPSAGFCLTLAVVLGAGGLFMPLLGAVWLTSVPVICFELAMVAGASTVFAGVFVLFADYENALIFSGGSAMLTSSMVLFCSFIYQRMRLKV